MMDGGASEADHWREVAAQKEKEWKEVTEQRITSLESTLQDKERQLSEERTKLQKLKDDFKYNFRLLGERDQELERYDASFADVKAQLNVKNAEVSDCRIQVDEIKTKLNCEVQSREELQLHYQARLREKQAEIDSYRNTKDGEIQEERKEFESFKRKLQRQLTHVEEEMDAQKREITMGFEDAMRRREHEFRIQADENSAKLLEYELKAKLLSKELDIVRNAQEQNSKDFSQVENNHRALEKNLKEKDWQLQDITSMKDATITDLTGQLQQRDTAMKRMQEEYERKHTEMDKYCREKECALTAAKEGFGERESELQNQIRDLQSRVEDAGVEIRRLQWSTQDMEKEKNTHIHKLQAEIQQIKEKWDKQIADVSRGQVNKDLDLQHLKGTEDKLKMEILQKKEDLERYKAEMSSGAEREANLERSKAQLQLDWQRRFEDLERQQYERSEDLIKKLTRARDEAMATVKEKEREIKQRDTLIRALQTDREHAFLTLKKHGIKVDKNVNIEVARAAMTSSEDVSSLQEQNESLRSVIREMRAQMEQLDSDIPDKNLQPQRGDKITEDYVKGLEKECRELRQKNREMEQDADVARRFGRQPLKTQPTNQEEVMSEVKDNVLVRNHIQSLNDAIGSLRADKVDLSAQVKKHQAHIQHQERSLQKHAKEQREKQVEQDQLQYELGASSRRNQAEIASLRGRISELELQLVEARKEADEYYKGNLEMNMEVTALGQELSGLKVDMAQKRPAINYGAQELLIQQLQDEIMNLKHQGADYSVSSDVSGGGNQGQTSQGQVRRLQDKLRNAAKKITELARERQQLIEMGNKLRAELQKAGVNAPMMAPTGKRPSRPLQPPIREENSDHMTSSQPLSEHFMNKLSQLEKLQYQLTKQELQYAQKFPSHHGQGDVGYSDTEEYRPPSILKKKHTIRESMDSEVDVRASMNTEVGETGVSVPPTARSQLLMSMSSMGGESLQEIWRMLDDGRPTPTPRATIPSPRATSPGIPQRSARFQQAGDNFTTSQDSNINTSWDFQLSGRQTGQARKKTEKKYSDRVAGKVPKKTNQKHNIRNYNFKDDSGIK